MRVCRRAEAVTVVPQHPRPVDQLPRRHLSYTGSHRDPDRESDEHFEAGQKELALGHLERAKSRVRSRARYAARIAGRRAQRSAPPRTFRPARRPHQRARAGGACHRRRLLGNQVRTGSRSTRCWRSKPSNHRRRRPATAEAVQADLESTTHDIPIPTNDRVLRYVELFQGRLREFLTEGLSRGVQYLPMIQATFRAEGLPLDLAYIPLIESAFKPSALSRAKARGVWQFMRGTALENGVERRLVSGRARRSDEGHAGGGEVPQDAARDVRRLASRDGVLQRRARPREARADAQPQDRFLVADAPRRGSCRARRATTCR